MKLPQTITKTSKDIVKEAMANVPSISAEEALSLLGSPNHVFVDLRDGKEHAKTRVIAGAITSSRGLMEFHFDLESPSHKTEFNQDKTYVFSCASRGRSALAAKVAIEMGLSPVVNMSGGVGACKKAGGALE
jgi:rhodanese-related sulfurtransferase